MRMIFMILAFRMELNYLVDDRYTNEGYLLIKSECTEVFMFILVNTLL